MCWPCCTRDRYCIWKPAVVYFLLLQTSCLILLRLETSCLIQLLMETSCRIVLLLETADVFLEPSCPRCCTWLSLAICLQKPKFWPLQVKRYSMLPNQVHKVCSLTRFCTEIKSSSLRWSKDDVFCLHHQNKTLRYALFSPLLLKKIFIPPWWGRGWGSGWGSGRVERS